MMTFDEIVPAIEEVLTQHLTLLPKLGTIVFNRDLNGRVRMILDAARIDGFPDGRAASDTVALAIRDRLGCHAAHPILLLVDDLEDVYQGAPHFWLDAHPDAIVVDRLTSEADWGSIRSISDGAPRLVFFAIKGGVGRSTALSAISWSLAQTGKRVLVLDLDLESPGLSTSLLPDERKPTYGITDWLVEDLVGNGDKIINDMVAISDLSHDGEIIVVPAHGREPGEYVAKLGRVWMSKVESSGRQSWTDRLNRMVDELEARWRPDVILVDSRAGIDEISSACVTELGAFGVLLFVMDNEQTWSGIRVLFRHWKRSGVADKIRDRLQCVGGLVQRDDGGVSFERLLERAWVTFAEELYDEVPPGEVASDLFSFDQSDQSAPHYPWVIGWSRGFATVRALHSRFESADRGEMNGIFGAVLEGVHGLVEAAGGTDD